MAVIRYERSFAAAAPSAVLAARLLLSWIFVLDGLQAIGSYQEVAGYMAANGVNGGLLPLVILTELGGGLLVAAGLFTRPAAIALGCFCLLTAFLFHAHFADPDEMIQFNKDLAIAGGFLSLAVSGAGRYSLDAAFAMRNTTVYRGRAPIESDLRGPVDRRSP